jgi:Flp pilus assembly protein protease CpaA
VLLFSILPILFWLSLHDRKFHRIPNTSLLALSAVGLFFAFFNQHSWKTQFFLCILILILGLIAYFFLGLGMGDVKLLVILAFLVIPADVESLQIFLTIFSISALIYALVAMRCKFRRDLAIPLAPAISIATVAALLG